MTSIQKVGKMSAGLVVAQAFVLITVILGFAVIILAAIINTSNDYPIDLFYTLGIFIGTILFMAFYGFLLGFFYALILNFSIFVTKQRITVETEEKWLAMFKSRP